MNTKEDPISILKQLIAIPSWVDEKTNEILIGEFIYEFLKQNISLQVTKQPVVNGRFNIIAQNNESVDTLIVGHIDTVQPSLNWTIDPLEPKTTRGKLFGLGSTDMKSGIAIMLSLAINQKLKPNTMFLFYIDEEYDFQGMKAFVKKYSKKIKPKQIISLDGNDLTIGNGCRGLIEVRCTIKGKSGHAARPKDGINAITTSYEVLSRLSNWLRTFVDPELGPTSFNLAYINGGLYQGKNSESLILGKQGNVIPDICEFIFDVRPSSNDLSAKEINKFINSETKNLGATLVDSSTRHDLGSWFTSKKDIPDKELDLAFNHASQTGYIDLQMLWKTFNKVPCFTVGAAEKSQAHKSDEYVIIDKLKRLENILQRYMTQLEY